MSNYIEDTLGRNERILYKGKVSVWSVAPLIILGGLLLPMGGIGLIFWGVAYVRYHKTELAFTNRRVIAKFGFISRQTVELNIRKVESIQVYQGITGRIFDFGTLIISGVGIRAPIISISRPMEFRRIFMEAQENLEE